MKKIVFIFTFFLSLSASAQQIAISRITSMPDIPSPYVMRNWKQVAIDYDNFIFDSTKVGTYLPLVSFNTSGVNYPSVQSIKLDSYVGQDDHGNVAEAINILPAIVGASLVGVDKTSDLNVNWVSKIKDFYNLSNGQNVYLNNYSASTGSDWWYELMPNIFFYQLYGLYPNADSTFESQYLSVANKELNVVEKLGGDAYTWTLPSMNYRAFNLLTDEPLATGVKEPEAAGSIAWLLYQAYRHTGETIYRYCAELSLDFLQSLSSNPSYEIQLPYGIAIAARMNAVEGTNFDIEKLMNWTFSSGSNTLRGWGTIIGTWNGYAVSGLIGEANDAGNDYAFVMNGFQHAGALAPVAKYDKRFAQAIAKWLLNLANASRLFYRPYLPQTNQESASYAWSLQYDTVSCIPYESMKETWKSTSPVAMGDAVKGSWASTDLSLYSGSSVGYLAAVVDTTNVSGILCINVNKTDFSGENAYPTYLYYNPYTLSKTVAMTLPSGHFDVYDMISDNLLTSNASESLSLIIPSDSLLMPVLVPAGSAIETDGRIFKVTGGNTIDYHYHYDYSNALRIKAFVVDTTSVASANNLHFKCFTDNADGSVNYRFFINDSLYTSQTDSSFTWTAPNTTGTYHVFCKVSDINDTLTSDTLNIKVINGLEVAPTIDSIVVNGNDPHATSSQLSVTAYTNGAQATVLWNCSDGTLQNLSSLSPVWDVPDSEGIYKLALTLSNDLGTATNTKQILIKNLNDETVQTPLIYYPFSGNTENAVQDSFNAVSVNAELAEDAFGNANSAYRLSSSSEYIYVPNEDALNFTNKIAISLWVEPYYLPSYEQFIISHGSWEERYKLSISDEEKVRWTVKTDSSTIDVDDPMALTVGTFVHYTVQYTGYSLEIYRNGSLVAYKSLTGAMGTTEKTITLARKDASTTDYNFRGTIDEVRIFNTDLNVTQIASLSNTIVSGISPIATNNFELYPNPFQEGFYVELPDNENIDKIWMLDLQGQIIWEAHGIEAGTMICPKTSSDGLFVVKVKNQSGKYYVAKVMKK